MAKSKKHSAPAHEQRLQEIKKRQQALHAVEFRSMKTLKAPIVSTRKGKHGTDAHRDFDGFDPGEELRRFRLAVELNQFAAATALASNLDEHMTRGGSPPLPWRGPLCMRYELDRDHRDAEAT